jgi:hypothetical protein
VVSSDFVVGGHHAICSSKNGSKGMYSGRIESPRGAICE